MRKLIVIAVAAVIGLGACGGSDAAASFTSPGGVLASISSTTAEKTSKADLSIALTGTGTEDIDITGSGAIDYENGSGYVNMALPIEGVSLNIETRFVDEIIYVKTSDESGEAITPRPWVRLDVAALAQQQGLSGLSQGTSSPTDGLDALRSAGTDIVEVGKEDVRGDETNRYSLQLRPTEMQNSDDAETREQGEALMKVLGTEPIPAEVWVDEKDRVRKIAMTIDLAKLQIPETAGSPVTGTMAMTYEFYDFGTDVNVTAPPAEETMDFAEVEAAAAEQPAA